MHVPTRVFLFVALGIAVALFPLAASASVLWFGDKDGLHQIDTASNAVLLNVPFEAPVGIAVNAADGSVWVLAQNRLVRLSGAGDVQSEHALKNLGSGLGAPRLIALNPNDGTVWVAFENRILHIDPAGDIHHTVNVSAVDLAVAPDGSIWVLTQSALQQFSAAGAPGISVPVRGMTFLAVDDTGGAAWLAGQKDLLKLSLSEPGTTLLSLIAPQTAAAIAVDVQTGDLWMLGQNGLFSWSREGVPLVSRDLRDFSIANSHTLVFDFASQAVWVGHQQGISRITVDGTLAATFSAAAQVGTIAIGRTPVDIEPVLSLVSPLDGALVNDATPLFRVDYDALCSGLPCGFPNSFFSSFSLQATLNGTEVGASFVFDPATGGATFTPATPLPEGPSSFSAQARDAFGHLSNTVSATFTIDSIGPVFQNVAPPSGSVFTTNAITISGSTDDPSATITLGAQSQGPSFAFPVTLSPGSNNFTLVASDPAGNTTALTLSYTFEPPNVPPSVSITSPLSGANFTAPATIAITAQATDTDGTIVRVEFFSNGDLVGTDTVFPYAATLTDVGLGSYTLTARATDNRDGSTTSDPVSVTVGPPNSLPTVSITSPLNNTAYSAPASVRVTADAADSDGTVSKVDFLRNGVVAATDTEAPYDVTLTNVPAGTHTLTARATDDRFGATTSAAITIVVSATTLNITFPAPNATINGENVVVTGNIVALPNSGVRVNDIPAAVDAAGNFFVLVPLTAGANTLTAILDTIDGASVTRSINVNATGLVSPYAVTATPPDGPAPLFVTFTVTNPTSSNATFMFDTFGPFNLPALSALQLSLTYDAGVSVPAVVITGAQGTFTHRLIIESRDIAAMDAMFRAIWNGLNNALLAGDKAVAMRYLNDTAKAKFGPVFDVLMPFMAEIVGSYSPLARSSITGDISEYAVKRTEGGVPQLYLIYFLRGADGIWRIDEM